MTENKKVSLGKVAGISLLSIVMIFAAAAPSLTQAHAGESFEGIVAKNLDQSSDIDCFEGIEIVQTTTTTCAFIIDYLGDPAIVEDTVPAEWKVMSIDTIFGIADCTWESAGKKVDKSATKITCAETSDMIILVTVETRESPGNKNPNKADKFKPTSCGDLVLNDGAVAYASAGNEKILEEVEPEIFEPIVIDTSEPITLTAINPDGLECGLPEPDDD